MFSRCSSLVSLDLSNFDNTNVYNMNYMFFGCSSLISLNLSNFDTTNVEYMNCMFQKCCSLVSLNFNISKSISNMRCMFEINKLFSINFEYNNPISDCDYFCVDDKNYLNLMILMNYIHKTYIAYNILFWYQNYLNLMILMNYIHKTYYSFYLHI